MSDQDLERDPATLRAAEIMTRAPRTCSTYSSVLEAVMIFRDNDCGAVPVLDESRPVAVLTDRDVALALAVYPDVAHRQVTEIMVPGVVTVQADDSLERVCGALRSEGVRRVLVLDRDAQVVGIIGWADIAPVLSDSMMGRVVKDVVAPAAQ